MRIISKLGGQERGIGNLGNYQTAKKLLLRNTYLQTLTYENGLEFSEHEKVSIELGGAGYFCAPYFFIRDCSLGLESYVFMCFLS